MQELTQRVYLSCNYEGTSKVSKRGNKHLRRGLCLMTVSVILNAEPGLHPAPLLIRNKRIVRMAICSVI